MKSQGRRIGDLTIVRALEMVMPFDRRAFFPGVTDEQWAPHFSWLAPKAYDPESDSLIFPLQSYVVRTSHHTILIDTCIGNHKDRPGRPQWHQKTDTTYLHALAAHGLSPADIDFVFCTHLHSDHVGWNTRLVDSRWVPTFPNARYLFSRREWEHWSRVEDNADGDVVGDSVRPIVAAGLADLVEPAHRLTAEVWLEPTPGHTPGHSSVRISSRGEEAVITGDVMHHPVQCAEPGWRSHFDVDPEAARRTRLDFLARYADCAVLVLGTHFATPTAGRIVRAGSAWRFED
jgi:glyoxylase-like metal-dependent hydrolase (beta-lactamase superfamily II)